MGFDTNQPAETNRDRVRRLLLQPLGFRHPRKTDEATGRALLDAIADEMAYLPDDVLIAMVEAMRARGDGASKDFWPSRASFIGVAEWLHPRPLEFSPKLLSWFASIEGPRAIENGTLVETWQFFEQKKRPPSLPEDRKRVEVVAQHNARKLQLIAERRERGREQFPDDLAWERWYLDRRLYCEQAVADARAGKAVA